MLEYISACHTPFSGSTDQLVLAGNSTLYVGVNRTTSAGSGGSTPDDIKIQTSGKSLYCTLCWCVCEWGGGSKCVRGHVCMGGRRHVCVGG